MGCLCPVSLLGLIMGSRFDTSGDNQNAVSGCGSFWLYRTTGFRRRNLLLLSFCVMRLLLFSDFYSRSAVCDCVIYWSYSLTFLYACPYYVKEAAELLLRTGLFSLGVHVYGSSVCCTSVVGPEGVQGVRLNSPVPLCPRF